ncbi:MAG: TrmB family transcriptional regulator [Thermoplasmatota archaeon]
MRSPDEELRSFGLSGYEARAYTASLGLDAAEASDIAKRANVPTGRIYDILNSLVEKRLLIVQGGRPKRYVAAPPSEALAHLLSLRRREFDEEYEGLTRAATELERRMLPKKREASSPFYRVMIGEQESRAFLAEKAHEARREIVLTLQFERYMPIDESVFSAYADAVARGVSVRALVRDEDIPRLLDSPYNDLIARTILPALGEGIDVRIVDRDQTPFAVVDQEKALVAVKNPLDSHAYFALVYVWDPAFARELSARFETLWAQGSLDMASIIG